MTSIFSMVIGFLKRDVWRIRVNNLPAVKAIPIKILRILLVSFRGMGEDRVYLRASALTFYSLLSIVPVLAMAFGIAKGFGFEKILERQLLQELPGQKDVLLKAIEFANSMLATTKGGVVAGIGLAALFWAVIKVIGNIEASFNDIWGITQQRSFGRKFSDYLSIMMICPLLMITAGSATVFITTRVTLIAEHISLLGYFTPVIFFALKAIPLFMVGGMFTFIYIFMPNTRVRFTSGLAGGMTAGAIYQAAQWAYISFQVGVARLNAIYGSFAALPLFLIWLQLSWTIVLFGAEISFACQNVDAYEFEPDRRISPYLKAMLSIEIVRFIVKRFLAGDPPVTPEAISRFLEVPIRVVRELVTLLLQAAVLVPVMTESETETAYIPGRDVNVLTVYTVLAALFHNGVDEHLLPDTERSKTLYEIFNGLEEVVKNSEYNRPVREI